MAAEGSRDTACWQCEQPTERLQRREAMLSGRRNAGLSRGRIPANEVPPREPSLAASVNFA